MKDSAKWIEELNLLPHPEGGYYRETSRSPQIIKSNTGLDVPLFTNILFLLERSNPSKFHQILSAETWYFHDGNPLTVHCIEKTGKYSAVKLGKNPLNGEHLQFEVNKDTIFGSSVEEGYALVSCMVSPGFDFREFKLFKREELLNAYPQHSEIIKCMT